MIEETLTNAPAVLAILIIGLVGYGYASKADELREYKTIVLELLDINRDLLRDCKVLMQRVKELEKHEEN